MNGNYRNQQPFLLSPSSSAGSASNHSMSHLASLKSRYQQHQQSLANTQYNPSQYQANGLPSAPVKPSGSVTANAANNANKSACPAAAYHSHSHKHQQSIEANTGSEQRYINDRFGSRADNQSNSRANRIMPPEGVQQSSDYYSSAHEQDHLDEPYKHYTSGANSSDNYVNQLRQSQLKHRVGLQPIHPARQPAPSKSDQFQQQPQLSAPNAGSSGQQLARDESRLTSGPNSSKPAMHVNFNRSRRASNQNANNPNQSNPVDDYDDEEEEHGRKKKYLTAKYGQQQMNLIKKRLKIETWLYEQLKDLAKCSKSEAELDEIDIDLDQLLDMDDDDTRRRWLRKTLEPFDDLPSDRVEAFVDQVLEQSKLL